MRDAGCCQPHCRARGGRWPCRNVLSGRDVGAWVAAISALLDERSAASSDWRARGAASLTQARRFSWREHARRMTALYRDLLPHVRLVPHRIAASQ
jgi:glycosyltransferase involved in cell wall biosynthesis